MKTKCITSLGLYILFSASIAQAITEKNILPNTPQTKTLLEENLEEIETIKKAEEQARLNAIIKKTDAATVAAIQAQQKCKNNGLVIDTNKNDIKSFYAQAREQNHPSKSQN